MNPIVGDLFEYTGYLSELGIKDLLVILEDCFEMGLTQEEALEYFKEQTEQDFTSKNELKSINDKCKKIFSENYNLALKAYILKQCAEIMTKGDKKLAYLEKKFKFLTHDDYKEIVFTTKDGKKNPILLMYGTETGFGLIHSFQKYKVDFEQWDAKTPYQVAEIAYDAIKNNRFELDTKNNMRVYQFKHLNNFEYLGVKINQNGKIIEFRPYDTIHGYKIFKNTHYLGE